MGLFSGGCLQEAVCYRLFARGHLQETVYWVLLSILHVLLIDDKTNSNYLASCSIKLNFLSSYSILLSYFCTCSVFSIIEQLYYFILY